jgi:hypothetical protein
MARRILNRRDLRDQVDAAERRKTEDEEVEEEEDEEEGDEEEAEAEAEGEEADEGDEEEEEEAPKKKPKKKAPPKAPKASKRKASKVVRQRIVWGVFNNSNQRVAVYPYPEKHKAEEHAARLKAESKTNQTHFVQPVKEPIEEK